MTEQSAVTADDLLRAEAIEHIARGIESRIGPVAYGLRIADRKRGDGLLPVYLSMNPSDLAGVIDNKLFETALIPDLIDDADHLFGVGEELAAKAISAGAASPREATFGDLTDEQIMPSVHRSANGATLVMRDDAARNEFPVSAWERFVDALSEQDDANEKLRRAEDALEDAERVAREASSRRHRAESALLEEAIRGARR